MRLFIAIKFNSAINSALLSIQEQMKRGNIGGKYSKPENLHLTLAFVGEYGTPDYVLETLEQVRFRPFELALGGVGSFGSRTWWAGITAPDELHSTAAQIRHYLAEADIPFDRRKFSPHITLIREPSKPAMPEIVIPDARMTVEEFSLFRSDRGKIGMNYTELGTIGCEL
ncbi:MAG: RNA 2',3'-cyclic phosphodiesterase [Ruminiclostridium sp.]|nr:RNA 2',3'-cyclic phosphodiesterase [Ruminiclostridium sp.]